MTEAKCPTCEKQVEVEAVEDGDAGTVMCLECGEEFVPGADKFRNFAVALVVKCEELKGGLKKLKVDVGGEELVVVTSAKHVEEGNVVVVAKEGAVVPAGAVVGEDPNAVEVKKAPVGGVKSEGMLCDSPMLGWVGGAAGVAVKLSDSFSPGDLPPMERPRS